jgi:hypothetical protein
LKAIITQNHNRDNSGRWSFPRMVPPQQHVFLIGS